MLATIEEDLAKLSRSALEALVSKSIRDRAHIAREAIAAAPVVAAPTQRVASTVAGADVGLFRLLDDDVLGELLARHMTAVARHAFTHRVCKSFRAMGACMPWASIVLDEKCLYRQRPDNQLWITPGADFAQISSFIRASASALTALSITLKDPCHDPAAIVRLIRAAPCLTDLTLSGKKMSAQVTKPINLGGKRGVATLPRSLKRLSLGHAVGTSATTIGLLSSCTRLEHLGVNNSLTISALKEIFQSWRKARRGGEPLLESLSLGIDQTNNLPHLRLGTALPGLRVLKLRMWCDQLIEDLCLPPGLSTLHIELFGYGNRPDDESWATPKQYKNANNPELVRRVLTACPSATDVMIGWHLRVSEEKHVASTLPLCDALSAAPTSLKSLTLVGMCIKEGALDHLRRHPNLRELTLCQCFVDAPLACKALGARQVAASARVSGFSF